MNWLRFGFVIGVLGCSTLLVAAPPRTAPSDGLRDNPPSTHALTGARLVIGPGKVIEKGTIVIRDGAIVAAGAEVNVPRTARVWDLTGKTIYPGLIDAYYELTGTDTDTPTAHETGYWNSHVVPQRQAEHWYRNKPDVNLKLRRQGVGARVVAPANEIIRGTSALVLTGDTTGGRAIVKDRTALHMKLWATKAWNDDAYPNSPMGAMSLVRQAFYDARWYKLAWSAYRQKTSTVRPEHNEALEVLQRYLERGAPVVIDTQDWLYALRADQVGREFDLNVIIRGSGDEYQRVEAIRATQRPVIVPVNFPKAPAVAKAEVAQSVSLSALMHWDLAPENAARLSESGVKIAFTTQGLKDPTEFLAALRTCVRRGLSADAALRALTVTPAELFGVSEMLGTIEAGKIANLIVTDGDLFEKTTKLHETWVDGQRYLNSLPPLVDVRGTWQLKVERPDGGNESLALKVSGESGKLSATIERNKKSITAERIVLDGQQLGVNFKGASFDWDGLVQLSLSVEPRENNKLAALGYLDLSNGSQRAVTAEQIDVPAVDAKPTEEAKSDKKASSDKADKEKADEPRQALFPVNYPFGEFGRAEHPIQSEAVVFRNATVWTSGPRGTLKNADVLVESGKITRVGVKLKVPADTVEIDCRGKHISAGMIDCHSHIATDGGVNESGQTSVAEVRIADFIDATDVNIYRQLAGGITASHILHGSANTIGGQCQLVKFRWGALPEALKFVGAPPTIKFALGENVKQANWGDKFRTRYPQTRMGVEQLIRDSFRAAVEYRGRWVEYRSTKRGAPPRVDLELEALAEVVFGQRIVHCHAYRQDEILATLRAFEDFNVRLGTFHHILEGYKVADAMAKHGAHGSSFSDWWAYKFEVFDAIPYNGAVMHNAGVVVSFNSDDAELGRRMNLEAAKAVKYGGVSENEALKFVTLNPAKQLGVDDRIGSIDVGRDADLVVWSGSPLSTYSRCEQTWVDGRRYFDLESDRQLRDELTTRRAALIQRIHDLGQASGGGEDEPSPKMLLPRGDMFCPHCARFGIQELRP